MKILISSFLLLSISFSAMASNAERLFERAIYGVTEYKGRASSVLDNQMVNIKTHATFRKSLSSDLWKVSFAANGNTWIAKRTHVLYPTNGEVHFSITDEDGNLKEFIDGPYDDGEVVKLSERPFTYYIVETDYEYEKRMKRIDALNEDFKKSRRYRETEYPKTGKFIARVNFDISSPAETVDFFEIVDIVGEIDGEEAVIGQKLIEAGTFRKKQL
jgi:hypothetical protein